MKEWFFRFALHALWTRRKALYYAVTVLSIAANVVVLVGPSVQTLILSRSAAALPAVFGSLHAAASIGTLQARVRDALPQVSELVLQRPVLYMVLNVILASMVVKSGMLTCRTPMAASSTKQEGCRHVNDFQGLSGSHSWLAPSYLNTVCSTIANFADLSSMNPDMYVQHARFPHIKGSTVGMDVHGPPIEAQQHQSLLSLQHHDQGLQIVSAPDHTGLTSSSPSPAASPSLFTIEPLDELVQSMKAHQASKPDAKLSKHPLRKVATKVDLLQPVRRPRRTEWRSARGEKVHQWKAESGEKHGMRMKEQYAQRLVVGGKDKTGVVEGAAAVPASAPPAVGGNKGVRRKKHHVQSVEHECCENGDNDDSQLSRQEFNERVDTFICKFKRNLTMQRKDSLNRLLGLY